MSSTDPKEMHKQALEDIEERKRQIRRRIDSELGPFFEGVATADPTSRKFSIFKESFLEFRSKYESKRKIFDSIMDIRETPDPTGKLAELYMLFLYLGAVESIGNAVVDILVMLLVANERDFHIECRYNTPRIKHVVSIRDLEEERVPLTTKLNFLRDNGLSEIAGIVDSQLRNDIAHLNFQVKENKIFIGSKRAFALLAYGLPDLWTGIEYTAGFLHGIAQGLGIVPEQETKKKVSE